MTTITTSNNRGKKKKLKKWNKIIKKNQIIIQKIYQKLKVKISPQLRKKLQLLDLSLNIDIFSEVDYKII